MKREVRFFDHRVSSEGNTPDPKNLEAIQQLKPPRNVREVRRFIGMCGFYRKFVPSFSRVATLITNLMKSRESFKWIDKCQEYFDALKGKLMSVPVLISYQLDLSLILAKDASDECVGAVIHQVQLDGSARPLDYFS